jgi:hypothetical protein
MTEEEKARRIIAESFETLDRLREREESEKLFSNANSESPQTLSPGGHFDPVRARRIREPDPEPEVRFSEPLATMPPAPAQPVIGEDFVSELIAHCLADVTAEYDRKFDELRRELRTEVHEVRREILGASGDQLRHAVERVDELVTRLERREPRGEVVDLRRAN